MQNANRRKTMLSHQTLTNAVGQEIEERILSGELTAGDKIVEEDLARQFGVSRTPVKIALVELSNEGIVEVIPRRGAYVKVFSEADIHKVQQVRSVLEGLAGRLAAPVCTPKDVTHLRHVISSYIDLIPELASTDSKERNTVSMKMKYLDLDFHNYILEMSGNEYLIDTAQRKHLQFQCFMNNSWAEYSSTECNRVGREHEAILSALESHDADASEKLLIRHIMRNPKEGRT